MTAVRFTRQIKKEAEKKIRNYEQFVEITFVMMYNMDRLVRAVFVRQSK